MGDLQADEEIRTLDPLLGKRCSTTELHPYRAGGQNLNDSSIMHDGGALGQVAVRYGRSDAWKSSHEQGALKTLGAVEHQS